MGSPAPPSLPSACRLAGRGLSLWPPLVSTLKHHSLLPAGRGASRARPGFCNVPQRRPREGLGCGGGESVGASGRCLCNLRPGMGPGHLRRWAQHGHWASALATFVGTQTSASPSGVLAPKCLLPPSLPWDPPLAQPQYPRTSPHSAADPCQRHGMSRPHPAWVPICGDSVVTAVQAREEGPVGSL